MHQFNILKGGNPEASKALVMIHGRGALAADFLSFADHLDSKDFFLLAPQATNNSWYPYSFLANPEDNQPWLDSALAYMAHVVSSVRAIGIPLEKTYLMGFSQGACLALEFAARNAQRYGGVIAFTGGLIGDRIYPEFYSGDFEGTPIFIGTSNPDFHVPVTRVYATANLLREQGAAVTEKVYDNMGHTINQDEIGIANTILNNN